MNSEQIKTVPTESIHEAMRDLYVLLNDATISPTEKGFLAEDFYFAGQELRERGEINFESTLTKV